LRRSRFVKGGEVGEEGARSLGNLGIVRVCLKIGGWFNKKKGKTPPSGKDERRKMCDSKGTEKKRGGKKHKNHGKSQKKLRR